MERVSMNSRARGAIISLGTDVSERSQSFSLPLALFEKLTINSHDHVSQFYAVHSTIVCMYLILEKRGGFKTDQFCICFIQSMVIDKVTTIWIFDFCTINIQSEYINQYMPCGIELDPLRNDGLGYKFTNPDTMTMFHYVIHTFLYFMYSKF